jgi:hypothetical protein
VRATIYLAILYVCMAANCMAASSLDDLRKEVESLRRKVAVVPQKPIVDKTVASRFGTSLPVETKTSNLYVGGLLQLWYYSIQNDNRGLFDSPAGTGIADTNEASDNDSFHVRRAELALAMNIHKNVSTYMMLDFAYGINSIPFMPSNQNFRTANYVARIHHSERRSRQSCGRRGGSIRRQLHAQRASGCSDKFSRHRSSSRFHNWPVHVYVQLGTVRAQLDARFCGAFGHWELVRA